MKFLLLLLIFVEFFYTEEFCHLQLRFLHSVIFFKFSRELFVWPVKGGM